MVRRGSWALLLLTAWLAWAAEPWVPAAPRQWVTDTAGLLSSSTREQLNQRLSSFERQRGHQLLVWVGETTGDVPIDEFAVRSFEAWKVGRAGLDDGLVVFVLVRDRTARIEVGYGLEERVPDAVASRILREHLLPGLSASRADEALSSTIEALVQRIDSGAIGDEPVARPVFSLAKIIVFVLLGLGFLVLFMINPALAMHALFTITALGRGRHSGGGWGFSGRGGRSGGGGASGSW